MRFILLLLLPLTLFGCSFGGFKPAPPYYHWRLHNSRVLFPNSDPQGRIKFLDRRQKICRIAVWILSVVKVIIQRSIFV